VRDPVTPGDLDVVVAAAALFVRAGAELDWSVPAGEVSWSCWETADHMADDLFAYAVQLAPAPPGYASYAPIAWRRLRDGGPAQTIITEPESGVAGMAHVLEACGALLSAMVRVSPPGARGWHPSGVSDAEGFAAMGILEVMVHCHDLSLGLGLPWEPDEAITARVLARLFHDVPTGVTPWAALLWCTGRIALPDRERQAEWRWDGTVR
jgi:hypothetical protein